MKRCLICGTETSSDSPTCLVCGEASFEERGSSSEPRQATDPYQQSKNQKHGKRRR